MNTVSKEFVENIKDHWKDIKAGGIRPFEHAMYLMYDVLFLLSENGPIDPLLEFSPFLTVWLIWKEHPQNKALKHALIEEVDNLLDIATGDQKK